MKKFKIIVGATESLGIGFKSSIPWHIKEDMQYFKAITSETQVINNILI